MVKNIKFSLILLLLIFVSIGAVSASEDVNATVDSNIISDNDVSYESVSVSDDVISSGDSNVDSENSDVVGVSSSSNDSVSYEPVTYKYYSDSDVITAAASHKVSSSNYNTYFDSNGNLKSSSVNVGDTMELDGSFSSNNFIFNKALNIAGTSTNSMSNCKIVLLSEASGSTVSNLNIVNSGTDMQGILLKGASNCNISNNKISCAGTSSFPMALNPGSNNNTIANNVLVSSGETSVHGKSLCALVVGGSYYNTITANNVTTADANAIYFSSYDSGSFVGGPSYNNVVSYNIVKCSVIPTSWNYGIQLMGSNNTAIYNTVIGTYRGISSSGSAIIKNNNIINCTGKDYNTGNLVGGDYAIVSGQNSVISNNVIENALLIGAGIAASDNSNVTNNVVSVSGTGYGIDVSGNNVLIKNNTVTTNNSAAIYQMGQYDYLTVTNNTIVSNNGVGVLLKKQSSTKFPANIVITDNDIKTGNQYAIDAAEADKTSFTIKDNECHSSQILTPTGKIDPSKPEYVFNGTTYTVTPVNYAQFFDEQGNLNSSIKMRDILNFVGNFSDKTMVINSGIKILGKNAVFNNSMFKVTSNHVWIENITINNANSSIQNRWGIYVSGTNQVKILNNTISVVDKNAAYAIYLYKSGNVEVINNTLFSNGNYLTYTLLGYGVENSEFSGNVIKTLGTGELHLYESSKCIDGENDVKEIFRTYGILMIYSSDNKVLNNNVTVNSLVNQSQATVSGNLSTNSLVGIDFYFDSNDNVISGNNILVEGKDNYLYGAGVIGAPTASGNNKYSTANQFIGNNIKLIGDYFTTGLIAGYHSNDTIIENNELTISANNLAYGMTLEASQASTIINNTIDSKAQVIYGIEAFSSNNNKIAQNTIIGIGNDVYGIAAAGSKYNNISGNVINSNGNGKEITFKNWDSIKEGNAGIFLTGNSTSNSIIDNSITSNIGYPVNLNATAQNNIITDNYLSGKEGSGDDGVNNSQGNTVKNNYKYTFENVTLEDVNVSYLGLATIKISAKLPFSGGISAIATFYINGVKIGESALSSSGVAEFRYQLNSTYVPGSYKLTATLSKNNYKSVSADAVLNVVKSDLKVSVDDVIGKSGNSVYLTAYVKNSLNEGVSGITVEFYRNALYIGKAVSDNNGIAQFIYKIPASLKESINITAKAIGNTYYSDGSANGILTIGDMYYTVISADDVVMYYKNGTRLSGVLKDLDGNIIANADVNILINGMNYTKTTDANGKFSMALNLKAGNYSATIVFANSSKYHGATNDVSVLIKSTISSQDVTKMFRNGTQYYAAFFDGNGKPLVNTDVKFNINGVWYTRTTNAVGVATLSINLNPGKYVITAVNPNNGEEAGNNIAVLSLITENYDLVKYFQNASQYKVKVYNQDGSVAGAGEEVIFNINGVLYKRATDANGYATLSINLNPADYIITALYKNCTVSNKITVKPVLYGNDLNMKQGDGSKFSATLLDGQGKAFANQNVTFNINGVFYNRTTDANGIASLNINLIAGKYIITSSYNNAAISNTITIA